LGNASRDGDVEAESPQPANEVAGDALGVDDVQVRCTEVSIFGAGREHRVDGAEDLVRNRDGGM
jgi:hypothetical protein